MSEIITFYSYKGGVGRTMALANVSVMLSKWGHKVLVVDWDLEAPGLEHFYKDYIDRKLVERVPGVIDLLQFDSGIIWQNGIIPINIPQSDVPIHLISSGRRNEDYFKKVRSFDVDLFYDNDGGEEIEKLRNQWLANYDYVLIDSRTGITEIGGICTIQLPDIVVMLFTATDQGFEGVLDIISRARASQQKLQYDRQKLIFLPIPSKFDSSTEFELSQNWLKKFADNLEDTYADWLPSSIDRIEFLKITKIPYIPYFSFGEKLSVIEQGVKDPSGLGYAYENLAAVIASHLNNVEMLFTIREQFIARVNNNPLLEKEITDGISNNLYWQINKLKNKLNINSEDVKFEMSKQVILDAIKNSIYPLLFLISKQLNKIDGMFREKKESVEFIFSSGISPRSISFRDMNSFLQDALFNSYQIGKINYNYSLIKLRKYYKKDINISISISITFFQLIFEISSEDGKLGIDKLYHEVFSNYESETIANSLSATILEKIGLVLNE